MTESVPQTKFLTALLHNTYSMISRSSSFKDIVGGFFAKNPKPEKATNRLLKKANSITLEKAPMVQPTIDRVQTNPVSSSTNALKEMFSGANYGWNKRFLQRQRTLRLDDMGILEALPENNKIYKVD